ncbi:MAG: radical SAM protein [Pirellulaceae bacterium]|nr:radical SAM protein [Pirellulaceae bacterium]
MITTTSQRRDGRRVALLAQYAPQDPASPQLISNHGMRMVEATLRAAELPDLELQIYDLVEPDLNQVVSDLLWFDPDVIGFSCYLWSFPFFLEVAQHLKLADPSRLIVLGGPSARPSMMNLPPYLSMRQYVDALVSTEGELTFLDIVLNRERTFDALSKIAGVILPMDDDWFESPARPLGDLNELASPYQMGLASPGGLGVLQTYRGCPFTCSFCEWGTMESPKRVRSVEDLCREFEGMRRHEVQGALLVDAGLNLNQIAFKNLHIAARETQVFEDRHFICEVYPAKIQPIHLDFLRDIGRPLVGMGLQSFDNEVLAHVERSYDEQQFDNHLQLLTDISSVALEIILGLPGDGPENFRKSFHRARELPCALRVYHCVVLPSALMVRAPESYDMDYDMRSLKMRSCLGWSAEELQAEVEFLDEQAQLQGGDRGEFFWVFSPPR